MNNIPRNSPEIIGDVLKILAHTIERIFEEQRLQREILLSQEVKSGATDRLEQATYERHKLWESIRQLETNVAQVVVAQATQGRKIDEIRDWLMPRSLRFKKWWHFWKSK